MTWARLFRTKEAKNVTGFLKDLFNKVGVPERYLCDNGGEFIANIVKDMMTKLKVKGSNGMPYKPSTQGVIERAHQPLKQRLGFAILQDYEDIMPDNEDEANKLLSDVVNAKNCEMHYTTGFKPIEVSTLKI